MITNESNNQKKCCLYASDFHLEMILLPYIKERINKSNIIIVSQNDLSDSIKVLIDRINIKNEEKNKILNLNWNISTEEYIKNVKKLIQSNDNIDIIINGDCNYIKEINEQFRLLSNNMNIIDCFSISDEQLNFDEVKNTYKEVLNTSKI